MRVSLVFPPQWTAAQPYFALLSLNAHLRRAGHEVRIHDLNLGLMEHVLGGAALRLAHRRALSALELLPMEVGLRAGTEDAPSDRLAVSASRLAAIEAWMAERRDSVEEIVSRAGSARAGLRDPGEYFSPEAYARHMWAVDEAARLFSLPFHPSELRWNHFVHPHCPLDVEALAALARSRTDNPFRTFFAEEVSEILEESPDMIALSINAFSQVVPGLTLAAMLKEMPGGPHVSIGGNFFSRLGGRLRELPSFFEIFADSLTVGEGERAIVEIAGTLAAGREVPRIVELPNYRMDEMAHQDPTGLRMGDYLSPERVLCIRASKGCYYGQCTFCDSYHGLANDVMEVERFVAELSHLSKRHGIRHFELVDQCIAPGYMEKMCDAILAAGLDVCWFCNARTEPGFTPELFRKMRAAGATMVMWGVESGSPRLLRLMKKGVPAKSRLEILRAASDAGLFNFAYVFFGFPTETAAEAEATIALIEGNTGVIHAYGKSVFTLGKHSPLMTRPGENGILAWIEDSQELSTNLSYETSSGLGAAEMSGVLAECQDRCRRAYGDPLWMALRTREALHLYLAHHGRDYVRSYKVGCEERDFVF